MMTSLPLWNVPGKCFAGLAVPSLFCGLRQGWLACGSLISPSCLSWNQGWHFPSSSPEALLPVVIFLSTPGCVPSRPMELWMSSLNKHCLIWFLSMKGMHFFLQPFPLVSGTQDSWRLSLAEQTGAKYCNLFLCHQVPCHKQQWVHIFYSLTFMMSALSAVLLVVCYISCLIQFHFGFNFSNCISACSYNVAVFLRGYLSLIPLSIFHLLYSSFLHLSFAWSSLFIHASLLAFLPDFLLIGMDGSCVWRRWYLNTKQLFLAPFPKYNIKLSILDEKKVSRTALLSESVKLVKEPQFIFFVINGHV